MAAGTALHKESARPMDEGRIDIAGWNADPRREGARLRHAPSSVTGLLKQAKLVPQDLGHALEKAWPGVQLAGGDDLHAAAADIDHGVAFPLHIEVVQCRDGG